MSVYRLPTKRDRMAMFMSYRLEGESVAHAWALTASRSLPGGAGTAIYAVPENGGPPALRVVMVLNRTRFFFDLEWSDDLQDYGWRETLRAIRKQVPGALDHPCHYQRG